MANNIAQQRFEEREGGLTGLLDAGKGITVIPLFTSGRTRGDYQGIASVRGCDIIGACRFTIEDRIS
jgi:hypothetical protein